MTPIQIKTMSLSIISGIATIIATALGGWDTAMIVLISIMSIDVVTGLMVALVWQKSGKSETGAADSRAMFKGLCRKAVMLLIVFLAVNLDKIMGLPNVIRTAVIFYFVGNEGLSILENLGIMGVPMPPIIRTALEQLRKKGEDEKPEDK